MKSYIQFICGIAAILLFIGFLSLSYSQPIKQESAQAAVASLAGSAENDFSPAKCDRIIPIGQPLEETVKLLAEVFGEQQAAGRYMESAGNDLQNIFAQLNKDSELICDFRNCSPTFADVGPEFTLEVDALVKKFSIGGHAPIPSNKECAGSPCPNLGDEESGYIASLRGWLESLQESADRVKADLNEDQPTITVTEDLAIYEAEVGQKITRAEAIRRLAERAAVMIKECTLSGLEEKRVLAGRAGAKYPMSCRDALEMGEYWPMPWSEVCREECKGEDSDKCYKCLEEKPVSLADLEEKTSILGRMNYKIYQQCAKECKDPSTGDWGFSQACLTCLCSDFKYVYASGDSYYDPAAKPTTVSEPISDEQCMDWLCGGSSHNWVCCHEWPIDLPNYDMVPHHSELGAGSESYGPELVGGETGGGVPIAPDKPPVGPGEEMVLTAYAPPCFCQGGCTSQQNNVGFGIIAVDKNQKKIPYKSRVWIVSDFQDGKFDKATKTYTRKGDPIDSFKVDGQEIANGAMSFCACDTGGDIKNRRIDVWMPDKDTADDFGVKFANVSWQYDEKCCAEKEICCKNPKAAGCQEIGNGLRCSDESGCCKEAPLEWNYLFERFGGTCP